jgi:hypothetical protein
MRIPFVGLNGPAPSRSTPSRPATCAQLPEDIAPSRQTPSRPEPPAARARYAAGPSSLLPPPSSLHLQAPTRQSRQSQVRHCSWSRAPGAIARCSRSRFPDPVPVQCAIPSPTAAPYPVFQWQYPVFQWPVQCSEAATGSA